MIDHTAGGTLLPAVVHLRFLRGEVAVGTSKVNWPFTSLPRIGEYMRWHEPMGVNESTNKGRVVDVRWNFEKDQSENGVFVVVELDD